MSEARELWARVIEEAIRDYVYGPPEEDVDLWRAEQRDAAEEWLFSDSEEPGSFLWVCEYFVDDPEYVRQQVREAREALLDRHDAT